MSGRVDLGEFREAYIAEAEEHVAAATAKLLAIEGALEKGTTDGRAVRDLYRAMHTLKGLSAMVGVEPLVALTHRIEAVLREADAAGGHIARGALDTIFEGVRAIEERVAAVARGDAAAPAPPALLERIHASSNERGGRADADEPIEIALDPPLLQKLAPFERATLERGARERKRVVRIDFVPSPKRASEGLTINSVRERVGTIAEIVKVLPLSAPIGPDAPVGLRFALLLVSSAQDVELAAAVGTDVDQIVSLVAARAPSTVAASAADAAPRTDVELPPPADLGDLLGSPSDERRSVLRIDVQRVDDALELMSGLLVMRSRFARTLSHLAESGAPTRELQLLLQETSRQMRDVRAAILRLRMVPFTDVLGRLPLVLRGIRRETGKDVRFVSDARDTELDKAVAERIFPALVHVLRNAVDHGIEPSDERTRAGKPERGSIEIMCATKSNRRLEITVHDDGRGIDVEAVARASGLDIDSPTALVDALCRPGLSTRTAVSTTSGRGMGMDIVKKIVVDQLGGDLSVSTSRGQGTTFVIAVPLTVAVLDAFTVQCGGERFAVPVASVEEILEVDSARVMRAPASRLGATKLLQRREEAVPLLELADVLGRDGATDAGRHALVVRYGGAPLAFGLERVVSQQEAVVRPLVDPLVQVAGIAGATDLGDGRATLVLDLVSLAGSLGKAPLELTR